MVPTLVQRDWQRRALKMSPSPAVRIRSHVYVAIALPLALAATLTAAIIYATGKSGEATDLQARASMVATVLAHSAQYDLLQGNKAVAARSMQNLIEADSSIRGIAILDADHAPLLAYGQLPLDSSLTSVEMPIVSVSTASMDPIATRPTNGFVRVSIAPRPLDDSQQRKTYLVWTAALLSALSVALAVRHFAGRMIVPLETAFTWLDAVRRGDFDRASRVPHERGLWLLPAAVATVADSLADATERLQHQALRETTELQATDASSAKADKERRRLLEEAHRMVEEERHRISLELHDTINASLIAIRLWAEGIAAKANTSRPDITRMADSIVSTANEMYKGTRQITKLLRPELLETMGVCGAIEETVRRLDETHADCRFEYRGPEQAIAPPEAIAMVAFRVAQEALTNTAKHSRATHSITTIEAVERPRHLRIVVADNGQGIDDAASPSSGLGMVGMRERVASAGGVFSIETSPNGTLISVLL